MSKAILITNSNFKVSTVCNKLYKKMLILYRSGGLGDFVKTWGVLRENKEALVVTKRDRGDLLNHTLGHEFLCDAPWQLFFKGKSSPPPLISSFSDIVVYRHEFFAKSDARLNRGLSSLNPKANIDLRNFSPDNCKGMNPALKTNESGRIIFHVGAGTLQFSELKTKEYLKRQVFPIKAWDLKESLEFAKLMRANGNPVDLIAGFEQRNQWTPEMLHEFRINGGSLKEDGLIELKSLISDAKCFIGFDSGPTHLAAQLGVPTFGMYGPTGMNGIDRDSLDLRYSEPLGPKEHLRLIHPDCQIPDLNKPRMQWLTPERAVRSVGDFLNEVYTNSSQSF